MTRKKQLGANAPLIFIAYMVISCVFIYLDQILKVWANEILRNKDIYFFSDLLKLSYVENRGAAFSLLSNWRTLLIGVPMLFVIIAIIGIIYYISKGKYYLAFIISLIMSGAVGNLIDRCFQGYVIDYIYLKYFAVFNLADILISVGCIFLILYLIFDYKNKVDKTI